jgi:large subunit ribosomal protein L4
LINVDAVDVQAVDPVSLVGFEKVVITVAALKKLEESLT